VAKDGKEKNGNKSGKPAAKRRKASTDASAAVNPVLAGILHRTRGNPSPPPPAAARKPSAQAGKTGSHQALAKAAVGRGIRHGYSASGASMTASRPVGTGPLQADASAANQSNATAALDAATFTFPDHSGAEDSLTQLANNYRNSLNDLTSQDFGSDADPTPLDQIRDRSSGSGFTGFLSRDSSLIDLAMIPSVDDALQPSTDTSRNFGLSFVDFPNPEMYPPSIAGDSDQASDE